MFFRIIQYCNFVWTIAWHVVYCHEYLCIFWVILHVLNKRPSLIGTELICGCCFGLCLDISNYMKTKLN